MNLRYSTLRYLNLRYFVLGFVLFVACMGQPHGLFLLFPQYTQFALVVILGATFYTFLWLFRFHSGRLPHMNFLLPALLFLSLAAISLVHAPDPQYGARILISMIVKVLFCLSIVAMIRTLADLRFALGVVSVIGGMFALQSILLVIAVLAGLQPIGEYGQSNLLGAVAYDFRIASYGPLGFAMSYINIGGLAIPRAQALFTEPGWFGSFLELTLFTTVAFSALSTGLGRKFAGALLIMQAIALFLTLSFAAWIAVGVGFIIYQAIINRGKPVRFSVTVLRSLLLAVVVITVAALALPDYYAMFSQHLLQKLDLSAPASGSSASQRISDAQSVFLLFREKPLFGWGINQVKIVNNGQGANNVYITALVELGIVGLISYLILLGSIAYTALSTIRVAYRSRQKSLIATAGAVVGGISALFIHSLALESAWTFYFWIGVAFVFATNTVLHMQVRHVSASRQATSTQVAPAGRPRPA